MITIGAGVLGVIVFLVLWLGFEHFWVGVIVGLIVAAVGHGITLGSRNRGGY